MFFHVSSMLNYKPEMKCKRVEKNIAEKWRSRFLDGKKRGADARASPLPSPSVLSDPICAHRSQYHISVVTVHCPSRIMAAKDKALLAFCRILPRCANYIPQSWALMAG